MASSTEKSLTAWPICSKTGLQGTLPLRTVLDPQHLGAPVPQRRERLVCAPTAPGNPDHGEALLLRDHVNALSAGQLDLRHQYGEQHDRSEEPLGLGTGLAGVEEDEPRDGRDACHSAGHPPDHSPDSAPGAPVFFAAVRRVVVHVRQITLPGDGSSDAYLVPILGGTMLLIDGANPLSQTAAAALFGLTLGAEVDVIAYLASRYFGLKNFGGLFGGLVAALSVGTAFGPLASGATFDRFGSYEPFLILTMVLMGISSLTLATLKSPPEWSVTSHTEGPTSPSESSDSRL